MEICNQKLNAIQKDSNSSFFQSQSQSWSNYDAYGNLHEISPTAQSHLKQKMLMLERHGQEAGESGKSGLEIATDAFTNVLSDKGYTGMYEISIRHLSKEPPLQVTLCDASSKSVLYEIKAANISLLHRQTEDEEMQKQHVVSEESPEDINDKWEDSLPSWDGWEQMVDSVAETRKKPPELPLRSILYVDGFFKGNSCYLSRIEGSIFWSRGPLPFHVWELEKLATKCKRVLLIFDEITWYAVAHFVAQHPHDYLLVQVGWDAESYLFLRKLAKFVPGLTFIAITDLDPHHLDRLAFLAAPTSEISSHYGWDLSEECKRTGVDEDAALDIKWLGLRPSDIEAHVACFKANACKQAEADFDTVINWLLTIPTVTEKKAWKDELQRLQDRRLFMPFSGLEPPDWEGCYITDVYLPQKLNQENWV